MTQPVSNVYQFLAVCKYLDHIWEKNTFWGTKRPTRYSIKKILANRKPDSIYSFR